VRWLAASLCCVAGCAGSPAVPQVVRIPVPVPCLETLPDRPAVAGDADMLALDDYRLVLTLARDRASLKASYEELRAAAAACVK
jgi:hypothetical protein